MKKIISLLCALIVVIALAGGYFIFSLNSQVNDLEDLIEESTSALDAAVNTINASNDGLKDDIASLGTALNATDVHLAEYITSMERQVTQIEGEIDSYSSVITDLDSTIKTTASVVEASVVRTDELYDTVKGAIVRISDGDTLLGSGFIMTSSPEEQTSIIKVVTAYHVIDGVSVVYVTLHDGRSYRARVYAKCEESDIVMLTLIDPVPDPSSVTSVSIGDSGSVKPGDPVFIVGSPGGEASQFGFKETVNTGIISQVNRSITIGDNRHSNLLQFDAAANAGNSGGPLFNSEGKVVGVVIARINPLIGDGIGFAVSSSMVTKVDDAIISGPSYPHIYKYPRIGLFDTTDVTPKDIVDNNNLFTGGVKVILSYSPASVAGVRPDDIINMIDGHIVDDSGEFFSYIAEKHRPGDTVTLNVIRNGTVHSIPVTLAES